MFINVIIIILNFGIIIILIIRYLANYNSLWEINAVRVMADRITIIMINDRKRILLAVQGLIAHVCVCEDYFDLFMCEVVIIILVCPYKC